MAMPHDARERAELCARLNELGPDAPTLAGEWTTFDLATHLVVRERQPLAGPGILLGGPFARLTQLAMQRERARGWDAVVDRVRKGPPPLPWRIPGFREALNLLEYFVHHEDVRRANGDGPRTDRLDLDVALARVLRRSAPLLLRRSGVDVALVDDRGGTVHSRGVRPPRVIGRPGELALWVYGRGAAADVAFDGTEEQLIALWNAELRV